MSEPMAERGVEELERDFAALRGRVAFPATPELGKAVARRLSQQMHRPPRPRLVAWRPVLLAAAAVLLVLAGASLLSATVRDAVAGLFGVPGIRIEIDRDAPTATAPALPPELDLGRDVPLTAINDAAGFVVAVLDPDDYAYPDGSFIRLLPDGGRLVSLVYRPDERFPETAETGIGVLLMQFDAPYGVPVLGKSLRGEGEFEEVSIHGTLGYWIAGSTELQILGDGLGPRASGNVLLWQWNGITFRMESALSRDEAIALAEEMTVIHPSLLTPTVEP